MMTTSSFTRTNALDMLNGMGSNGPVRFVRKAADNPSLFDTNSLKELAEGIDLNDNKRPSAVALGALYAGYLAAKRGISVADAIGYRYLGGALADVVEAADVEGAIAALIQSNKESQAARQSAALASGKAAKAAVDSANKRVDKMLEVFEQGLVSAETEAALLSLFDKVEAALEAQRANA